MKTVKEIELTETLVKRYGEKYRKLIQDSIEWLILKEKSWGLDEPIMYDTFVQDLMERVCR